MGTPLTIAPVYMTLAQVQFNTILALDSLDSKVQEEFRKAGYPDYVPGEVILFQINQAQDQQSAPVPVSSQQKRFSFGNIERTHQFILDNKSLTLQSTEYGRFEEFSKIFLSGLRIVNDLVNLNFIERVGLRYLDRVMPGPGETLKEYLVAEGRGLSAHLPGDPVNSYAETLQRVGDMMLLNRVAVHTGPLAFPPDLQPGTMKIQDRFVAYNGTSAILDNDGFFVGREAFSEKIVEERLSSIHDVIGKAFLATVTPFALEAWR